MPTEVLERKPTTPVTRPGAGGPGGGGEGAPGDGPHGDGSSGILGDPARFGLWAFLGTISMLFIGFTSAYLVRRTSLDWRPLSPPPILWFNTAALLLSTWTLEQARRRLREWELRPLHRWVGTTGLLGVLFVAGQVAAWGMLAERGIFLASNPHSSFFYVLSGLHALHLLGGLCWLGVVIAKVQRMAYTPGEDGLRLFATYWHFLSGLWVYLLVLLFLL